MCGEKHQCGIFQTLQMGSPPHVRGKETQRERNGACFRITPACAGKSFAQISGGFFYKDHPRMCGEKWISTKGSTMMRGSPPHVRGKEPVVYRLHRDGGITPACAGKRRLRHPKTAPSRDHPRMCGEKCEVSRWPFRHRGSPPHVRGKVPSRDIKRIRKGITPACAGKSLSAEVFS